MAAEPTRPDRQSARFLWLYALAWAGGAVAYTPFLTILLPVRVADLAPQAKIDWLGYMTFCGALSASVSAILFGWLSDRSKDRRPWIVAGLILTTAMAFLLPRANDPLSLLLAIMVWQMALNMMLGPLSAWAADHVPREQLGSLGGLLAFSPALGAAAGALVTIRGLAEWSGQLAMVAILVVLCVVPALIFAKPKTPAEGAAPSETKPTVEETSGPRTRPAVAMWFARFLVQVSEAALFAYLFYFFVTIDPRFDAAAVARLSGSALAIAVPLALVVGRWSDRHGRPIIALVVAAATVALALATLSIVKTPLAAGATYVVFAIASTLFLSLHSAQTFRVLPHGARRGRDLGIFNLTNTTPSLVMPWLTLAVVPSFGFSRLFLLLALLSALAAAILFVGARRRRHS